MDTRGLRRYVSRLAAGFDRTGPPHRREVGTLVSADLSGFTALSERLAEHGRQGSEELTAAVNACFTVLIDACTAEGGDVLKFGGDAILVWFAADDHEVRAVRAACRMQRALGDQAFRRAGLRMSIGVRSGPTDLFLLGDRHRELVVCGPAAEEVVGLEAAADAGEVLTGHGTAARLPTGWTAGERGGGFVVDQRAVAADDPEGPPATTEDPGEALDVPDDLVPVGMAEHIDALAVAGGEHRAATIAFLELEPPGPDRLAADGGAVAAALDADVRRIQTMAARYDATFLYSDVAADGIKFLLTAGAPISTGSDEESILRTAVDLVHASGGRLRAGVHRGPVFAGFLGSPTRATYTVMGDPVNLAARLMAKARWGQVLASDDVVNRASSTFVARPLPPFLVKGRTAPVVAHAVGARSAPRRGPVAAQGPPLVGRQSERAVIDEAIEAVWRGESRVVEIVGDAGIGKTRLVASFDGDPRLLIRLATECQPYDALIPYAGVRPVLRQAFGIAADAAPAEVGERLRIRLATAAPHLLPMLPLVAVPLGAEVEDTPEAAGIAPEFRTRRIHQLTGDALATLLRGPAMLVVEDVYYMDEASLLLLRALVDRMDGLPWLLCTTRRPTGPGIIDGDTVGITVKLDPLEPAQAAQLAAATLDQPGLSAADLQAVAERSGGNPLFVLELVGAAAAGLSAEDLPESIERLIAARIDRLPPEERMLLRQAAVVGRTFSRRVLDRLRTSLGQSPTTEAQLAALGELIEQLDDDTFHFQHALFRDTAYEGLPYRLRRELHERTGLLYEAGVAGEAPAAVLSSHFWLAGVMDRAWRYSVRAGEEAWRTYAVTEAVAAYGRAMDARRQLPSLPGDEVAAAAEAYGDALERAARYDEAAEAYAVARRAHLHPPRPRARLMRKLGDLCERGGRYRQALTWYGRALRLVETSTDRDDLAVRADLEVAYAGVRYRQGDVAALATYAERAAATAAAAGHPRARARALLFAQLAISQRGGGDTAAGQEALALFETIGDLQQQGKVLNNLGVTEYFQGRWREAADHYRDAADRLERSGDVVEAAVTRNNLAEILSDQGHLAEAAEGFERARTVFTTAGFPLGVGLTVGNLGRVASRRGDVEAALALLAEADDMFQVLGAAAFVAETAMRRVEALVLAGRPRPALTEGERAHGLVQALDDADTLWSGLHRARGWAHLQLGDRAAAAEAFAASLAAADLAGSGWERAQTLEALALLGRLAGDPGAEAHAAEAAAFRARAGVERTPVVPVAVR